MFTIQLGALLYKKQQRNNIRPIILHKLINLSSHIGLLIFHFQANNNYKITFRSPSFIVFRHVIDVEHVSWKYANNSNNSCHFYVFKRFINSYFNVFTSVHLGMNLCRDGHAAAAGHHQWSSESDAAARWRGVAAVRRRRPADTGSLLVQKRPRAALCRTRSEIRTSQLRHAPDFR